ncbi:hypothetical protein ACF0H5_012305 [Mactra antiquata]
MHCSTIYGSLGLILCFLATITLTYTSELEEITEDAVQGFPPNLRYFLNNMNNEGLRLEAPPHAYMNKLKRYLHDTKTDKRNGYWIWMPAQGYVPVEPNDKSTETKGSNGGNIFRFG